MAAEKYAYGIKKVKFGKPTGSDTMPTGANAPTAWAQTVAGSLVLSEDEATTKDFNVEEVSTPVKTIVTSVGALTATWRSYDITPSLLSIVKGGVATSTGSGTGKRAVFKGPKTVKALDMALEIITDNDIVFKVYKAAVLARFDGGVGKENLLEVEVRAVAQDPGNGGHPYEYDTPDPV
jgi:hypothetical protein